MLELAVWECLMPTSQDCGVLDLPHAREEPLFGPPGRRLRFARILVRSRRREGIQRHSVQEGPRVDPQHDRKGERKGVSARKQLQSLES
jgi:hypothetical protein